VLDVFADVLLPAVLPAVLPFFDAADIVLVWRVVCLSGLQSDHSRAKTAALRAKTAARHSRMTVILMDHHINTTNHDNTSPSIVNMTCHHHVSMWRIIMPLSDRDICLSDRDICPTERRLPDRDKSVRQG